ncbi:MAG: hypothetical protein N2450_05470 [bacterium]|nr:hypothetical protein [bacterium]
MCWKPLFIVLLSITIVSTTLAISLTDYLYPTSFSHEAYLNGTFNFNGASLDTTQIGYNVGGNAFYNLNYRSLPFSYVLSARGNLLLERSSRQNAKDQNSYSAILETRANKYWYEDEKIFGFGGLNLGYRKEFTRNQADDPYVDVTAGLGYGRYVNATVLKQAIRVSEDLLRFGVIKSALPDQVLLDLARVIDRESEFKTLYGAVEYKKYWYEEMETILQDANLLVDGSLGTMGSIRIEEVLAERIGPRYYGWEARIGGGAVLQDYNGNQGDPLATVAIDWSRPISLDLQLNNHFALKTQFVDSTTSYQSHTVTNTFQVYYELTNRIDWDNVLKAEYKKQTLSNAKDNLAVQFSSTFIFYIENQLTFNPALLINYRDNGIVDPVTDWTINGSVSYRLK